MKINLSAILRAFAGGAFGGVANVVLLVLIWKVMESSAHYSHGFLYHQIAWGGIWGLAFLLPILSGNWRLRGVVWGAAATAAALLVFKVVPVSLTSVIIGLAVNSGAWGLTGSWLYYKSGN